MLGNRGLDRMVSLKVLLMFFLQLVLFAHVYRLQILQDSGSKINDNNDALEGWDEDITAENTTEGSDDILEPRRNQELLKLENTTEGNGDTLEPRKIPELIKPANKTESSEDILVPRGIQGLFKSANTTESSEDILVPRGIKELIKPVNSTEGSEDILEPRGIQEFIKPENTTEGSDDILEPRRNQELIKPGIQLVRKGDLPGWLRHTNETNSTTIEYGPTVEIESIQETSMDPNDEFRLYSDLVPIIEKEIQTETLKLLNDLYDYSSRFEIPTRLVNSSDARNQSKQSKISLAGRKLLGIKEIDDVTGIFSLAGNEDNEDNDYEDFHPSMEEGNVIEPLSQPKEVKQLNYEPSPLTPSVKMVEEEPKMTTISTPVLDTNEFNKLHKFIINHDKLKRDPPAPTFDILNDQNVSTPLSVIGGKVLKKKEIENLENIIQFMTYQGKLQQGLGNVRKLMSIEESFEEEYLTTPKTPSVEEDYTQSIYDEYIFTDSIEEPAKSNLIQDVTGVFSKEKFLELIRDIERKQPCGKYDYGITYPNTTYKMCEDEHCITQSMEYGSSHPAGGKKTLNSSIVSNLDEMNLNITHPVPVFFSGLGRKIWKRKNIQGLIQIITSIRMRISFIRIQFKPRIKLNGMHYISVPFNNTDECVVKTIVLNKLAKYTAKINERNEARMINKTIDTGEDMGLELPKAFINSKATGNYTDAGRKLVMEVLQLQNDISKSLKMTDKIQHEISKSIQTQNLDYENPKRKPKYLLKPNWLHLKYYYLWNNNTDSIKTLDNILQETFQYFLYLLRLVKCDNE